MASSSRNVIGDHFQTLHTFTFKGVLSLVHPFYSKNVPPYHIKSEKSNCELLSCPTLCDPMDCSPPRLLCLWNSPGKNTGVGSQFPSPVYLPNPGIESGSPALAGGFFTTREVPPYYPIEKKCIWYPFSSTVNNIISNIGFFFFSVPNLVKLQQLIREYIIVGIVCWWFTNRWLVFTDTFLHTPQNKNLCIIQKFFVNFSRTWHLSIKTGNNPFSLK